MSTAPLDLTRLGPEGGKRSSKRDRIVDVFLRQEGHLSADDLVDLIRREDQRISRATVYRTLQWMVDAGIARKVDFGEGRFRFEHSYRHPRHFHLICKTCNQSSEFLSSDIEALIEEVAAARHFTARQSVLQIYGECEDCRLGRRAAPINGATTELLFARDALRIAIATERSGLEFYTRAAAITRDARGRTVFQRLAEEEKEHLGTLEARYRELLQQDPPLAVEEEDVRRAETAPGPERRRARHRAHGLVEAVHDVDGHRDCIRHAAHSSGIAATVFLLVRLAFKAHRLRDPLVDRARRWPSFNRTTRRRITALWKPRAAPSPPCPRSPAAARRPGR